MLALTFLVLFLGNFLSTLKVVHQKLQKNKEKIKNNWWYHMQRGQWGLTELNFKAHKTVSSTGVASHKLFGEGWR